MMSIISVNNWWRTNEISSLNKKLSGLN